MAVGTYIRGQWSPGRLRPYWGNPKGKVGTYWAVRNDIKLGLLGRAGLDGETQRERPKTTGAVRDLMGKPKGKSAALLGRGRT